jgi:hypothetical protein
MNGMTATVGRAVWLRDRRTTLLGPPVADVGTPVRFGAGSPLGPTGAARVLMFLSQRGPRPMEAAR